MHFPLPELDINSLSCLRIPPEVDVPVTERVRRILDTSSMQRLRHISQLGLVSLVYPGAVHTRFEHSLGVYRWGCLAVRHLLSTDQRFAEQTSQDELKVFLLAALLHDVGHWPYCHAIEDLRLTDLPRHEHLARQLICSAPLSDAILQDWSVSPEHVADFIAGTSDRRQQSSVLRNLLSGPVDIDKLDYLQRDSLHAGVPYGRNFDAGRLLTSLCVGGDGQSIAITEKGKTAAEMMVFARYVMFSEVYWHHTVRSATAMLQRLVFLLRTSIASERWLDCSERDFGNQLWQLAQTDPHAQRLASSLFGNQRSLYKRLAQTTLAEAPQVFDMVARRPYTDLVELSRRLAERLSRRLSRPLNTEDELIDAPPVKLEVQFQIAVRKNQAIYVPSLADPENSRLGESSYGNESRLGESCDYGFVPLSSISPVVHALATDQFDNFVKRIRVFISPERAPEVALSQSQVIDALLSVATQA